MLNCEGNSQVAILISIFAVVAPGPHLHHKNSTDNQARRACSIAEYATRAQCLQVEQELICKGGITREWIRGSKPSISQLRIMDWPGPCLDLGRMQQHFPELRILELLNCPILRNFTGYFDLTTKMERLTIHGAPSLWEISPEVIKNMQNLRSMDLRGNGIRHMKDEFLSKLPKLQHVYLSGKWILLLS
ncbi:hypothetical protein ACJJTC_001709 [Scirpophaga incertulas]